jgi:O-antigen ligase
MSAFARTNALLRGGILAVLVFAPLARGAVDTVSLCLIGLIVITCLFLFLLERLLRNEWLIKFSGLELPLVLLFLLGIASSFSSICPSESKKALVLFACCLTTFFLVQNLFGERKEIYLFTCLLVGAAATLALFGLLKYVLAMGAAPGKLELSGTYVNRNHFAGYLELCLPLALGITGYVADKGKKTLLVYGIVLMVVALVLTLSRGGWVSASASLAYMAVLAKKREVLSPQAWAGVVAVVAFLVVAVLGLNPVLARLSTFDRILKAPRAFDGRMQVWNGTVEIIKENPLLGTGIGTFPFAFSPHRPPGITDRYLQAHSDVLQFTSEMGLLFVAFWGWIVFVALKIGIKTFFRTESRLRRGVSLGCSAGIVALSIHSFFDFNLQIPANALLFSAQLGMLGALQRS